MEFDRVLRDVEAPCDLLVSQTIGEHVQNLRLARRQRLNGWSRGIAQPGLEDCWQMFKNGGMKHYQPNRHRRDRCHDLVSRCKARQNRTDTRVGRARCC